MKDDSLNDTHHTNTDTFKGCPKCGAMSGNNWSQCKDWCPMGAPHLPTEAKQFTNHCKACDVNYETDTRTGKHNCAKPESYPTIDNTPSCGMENDYQRTKPSWEDMAQKEFNSSQYGAQACDMTKPESVGTFDVEDYLKDKHCTVEREIWNAAIEAAAKMLDDDKWLSLPDKIRKLKK